MEPTIIGDLTSLTLELKPKSCIDIKYFFDQNKYFSDVTLCEQEDEWFFLTHKSETPRFRIEYNANEIRIVFANTDHPEELLNCMKIISNMQSFLSINLVFRTAFQFDNDLTRKDFFGGLYSPKSLLSDNDKAPLYNFKELLFEDNYKFILNILEDDFETTEKEEILAIVFSLECSPIENTTFQFASANELLKSRVNKIFKKMNTGYSI